MKRQGISPAVRRWVPGILAGAALLGGLVALGSHPSAIETVQRAVAVMTSWTLNRLGQSTSVVGTTVQSHVFGINVVAACTGIFLTGLFLIAVVVLPTSWRARLIGAALGTVGVFVINLVRLVSLYFVGSHWAHALDAVHQLVWQSMVIVLAVALWLWWAGRWADVSST